MPEPELGPIGELLYEAMGWWASEDEENDWTLAIVCDVTALVFFEPVYEIVREGPNGEPPWSKALDPATCPADRLPYVAQFPGAVLTPGMSEQQRREEITYPTGWARGRVPAIKLITQRELVVPEGEEPWVRIRPRTPGPGHIYIRTLLSQTPNPDRVEAELLEHGIPAWELLSYEAIDGVHWEDVEAGWKTYAELESAFADFDALLHMLADELP